MEIKKNSAKIKCEMPGCKNLADYSVVTTNSSRDNLNFCESCMKDMYKQFSKIFTPKSIKNVYQKGGLNG